MRPPVAAGTLKLGENPQGEALAMLLQRLLDTAYVAQIRAKAENNARHQLRARSTCAMPAAARNPAIT